MTFYGKDPEQPKTSAPLKTYRYEIRHGGEAYHVRAHHAYFYESGHVGFWRDLDNDERFLVLAIKCDAFWEDGE